jgi:hypothetical protein
MDLDELRLVYEMNMKGFPARRPEQSIFYPVLSLEYANEIAKQWNAESQNESGYVVRFSLDDAYGGQFKHQNVGASHHVELWIPAAELPRFNEQILPPIEVVSAHFGKNFQGHVPVQFGLRGKNATAQFVALTRTLSYSAMDVRCEIVANHVAIFLNYAYWMQSTFLAQSITEAEQEDVLATIRTVWSEVFPEIRLPLADSAK